MKNTIEKINLPGISKIIVIASGKGGVGKSTIATGIANALVRKGKKVGIMDADIYGPSIPLLTGTIGFKPMTLEIGGTTPQITTAEKNGIKVQSIGFFIENKAALWRGPMASNALMQLIEQSTWCRLDYLLIDLPPGTGDIQLSIFQKLHVNGAIVVTTPQTISISDAEKSAEMIIHEAFKIPILGIVENMSWFSPIDDTNKKYFVFGKGGGQKLADKFNVPLLAQIPLLMENAMENDTNDFLNSNHELLKPYFNELVQKI